MESKNYSIHIGKLRHPSKFLIFQLLLLLQAYVETEWPHVSIPLRNATHRKSDKIVFLFVDDVPEESLRSHPELKQYLKTCPTVRWGEPGFLNKLRYVVENFPKFGGFEGSIRI